MRWPEAAVVAHITRISPAGDVIPLVECRVLGAYKVRMSLEGRGSRIVRNDRIIAVPKKTLRGTRWRSLRDLGRPLIDEIEAFFETYVERQGRTFELLGTLGRRSAHALIRRLTP